MMTPAATATAKTTAGGLAIDAPTLATSEMAKNVPEMDGIGGVAEEGETGSAGQPVGRLDRKRTDHAILPRGDRALRLAMAHLAKHVGIRRS